MNSHTRRILEQQSAFLLQFNEEKLSLSQLVNNLYGGLSAIEESLPTTFTTDWYEYWGYLEEVNALQQTGEMTTSNPTPIAEKFRGLLEHFLKHN